ncbi:mitochondrial glycoprotein [Neoconidiobolus thromboides FSU 785]|nr:mitochondrial glycoprotein [Neoconidiobolus thromboides FSU 785]
MFKLFQRSAKSIINNRLYSTTKTLLNKDLSTYLSKEFEFELKNKAEVNPELPIYLQQSGYELKQEEGGSLVELHKKYNEKEDIIIRFSIADINIPPIQTSNVTDIKLFSKFDEFPIKCHIIISKLKKGSILFDSVVSDGFFGFIQIKRFENQEVQPIQAIKQIHLNSRLVGVPFEVLHEELKSGFEDYLEVRGIDHNMAKFIRDYISFKEQNEYMRWLNSLSEHVLK